LKHVAEHMSILQYPSSDVCMRVAWLIAEQVWRACTCLAHLHVTPLPHKDEKRKSPVWRGKVFEPLSQPLQALLDLQHDVRAAGDCSRVTPRGTWQAPACTTETDDAAN
jgi:hypothetical protein